MTLNAAVLGAGFIGKNFIRHALNSGDLLKVLDHKSCPGEFVGKLVWLTGDMGDEQVLRNAICDVDIVYHFISGTVPGDSVDESSELQQNVVQTLKLAKICIEQKVRRIVFISSASVYGIQNELPIPETALTNPISSHGIHKLIVEKYLQLYQFQHGLECKILRLSNPYGPGQPVTGRQGFIAMAIGKLLAGEPIMIRGDGSTVRDYIYIDDVSEVIHRFGTIASKESLFNIGSGIGYSLNEVASLVQKLTGQEVRLIHLPPRNMDIPKNVLDIKRIQSCFGGSKTVSFEEGLAKTLSFHGVKVISQGWEHSLLPAERLAQGEI